MSLELSRLQSLRCGPPGVSTPVGEIPREVAEYLQTQFRTVNLSRDTLEKVNKRHSDLSDFVFLEIPHLLRHGLWIGENRKPLCAVTSCEGAYSPLRYKVAIKRAINGPELWLTSFHRVKPKATAALLRRGHVIRPYTS